MTAGALTGARALGTLKIKVFQDNNDDSSQGCKGDPLQGTTYQVLRPIGSGGMGEVVLAMEQATGRQVAVKLIRGRFGHMPDLVARFYAEARAASQTGHPHIVEVLDFGTTSDDRPFMVMEYLPGHNLDHLLCQEGMLAQDRAISICLQICDALSATHVRGVIHRDLKPGNVFLTTKKAEKDFVKILDFGLAKLNEPGEVPEVPRHIYGTPEYMAPETARPARPPGASIDIYSLGVLLYEMLTGDVPFPYDDPSEVVESHLNAAPVPPRYRAPEADILPALERIVLKALRKRPERRFTSMEEMSRALWRVQRYLRRSE